MKPKRVFSGQCLNPLRIQDWFGGEKHFPELAQLVRFAEREVPVCAASGGGLALALRYSNHSSADGFVDEINDKIRDDVKFGRAFVFPREAAACILGLRVSPLAVIKSSTKLRGNAQRVVFSRETRERRHEYVGGWYFSMGT